VSAKGHFTDSECDRVIQAPMFAGIAVTAADPGGLWASIKEGAGFARSLVEAKKSTVAGSLLKEIASAFDTSEGRRAYHPGSAAADRCGLGDTTCNWKGVVPERFPARVKVRANYEFRSGHIIYLAARLTSDASSTITGLQTQLAQARACHPLCRRPDVACVVGDAGLEPVTKLARI